MEIMITRQPLSPIQSVNITLTVEDVNEILNVYRVNDISPCKTFNLIISHLRRG